MVDNEHQEDIIMTIESDKPVMHCYKHPLIETKISCGSCGRPLCPDCVMVGPVGVRCERCYYGYTDEEETENSVINDDSSVKKTTFTISLVTAVIFFAILYIFNLLFYKEAEIALYNVITAALYGLIVGVIVRAKFKRRNKGVVKWAMLFVMIFTLLTGVTLVLMFGSESHLLVNLLANCLAQTFLAVSMTYMFGMRKGKNKR